MEKEWGHLGHSAFKDKIEISIDYRHLLVAKNPRITDDLPTTFEDHSIEFLDDQELVGRYRNLKKSFPVPEVAPIRNRGGALEPVVGTYWFSYKKHRVEFAYSDWSTVEFRYDCGQGVFVVSSVKLGGI